jgi:hypothetical protein
VAVLPGVHKQFVAKKKKTHFLKNSFTKILGRDYKGPYVHILKG